jgi:hypothetical protein
MNPLGQLYIVALIKLTFCALLLCGKFQEIKS